MGRDRSPQEWVKVRKRETRMSLLSFRRQAMRKNWLRKKQGPVSGTAAKRGPPEAT